MKRVALAIVMLTLLAGCGGNKSYGDKSLQGLAKSVNQRAALGGATTTVTRAATAPTGKQTIGSTAPPTTARATTTTRNELSTLTIAINNDNDANGIFDPQGARVTKGSTLIWVNHDKVARSVEADAGAFTSPSLAPGQSFSWVANVVGDLNYHDGTRPYAIGIIKVVPKG